MSENARLLLRRIKKELGINQRHLGALIGRDQSTISNHLGTGVIPATQSHWIEHIREIRTERGFATITVAMPPDTPVGEYRRFDE